MASVCDLCKDTGNSNCLHKMNDCPNYKIFPRIYLQFNDLVFHGVSAVETSELSGDYKISTTPYPFSNGSYSSGSYKNGKLLMSEQDLSLDLQLPFVSLNRLQALNYNDYIKMNLSTPGKLWAIDPGGILIWAYAIPKHPPYNDYEIRNGKYLSTAMDFVIPEGVWHIADTNNVFLQDYDMCDFKQCLIGGCDHDCKSQQPEDHAKECLSCDYIDECMNWCKVCWDPYDNCNFPFKILYNCFRGQEFYGTKTWGKEFMGDENCLSGEFCSNTIIESEPTVTLVGSFLNPKVTINDTTIQVMGDYEGRLVFRPDGTVDYYESYGCDDEELIMQLPDQVELDDIVLISRKLSFTVHNGTNWFEVRSYEEPEDGSEFRFLYIKNNEVTF